MSAVDAGTGSLVSGQFTMVSMVTGIAFADVTIATI